MSKVWYNKEYAQNTPKERWVKEHAHNGATAEDWEKLQKPKHEDKKKGAGE